MKNQLINYLELTNIDVVPIVGDRAARSFRQSLC